MANRAFTPPRAGLASGSEGLGLLQPAGGSVFIPTLLGAHILSDPGLRNLGRQGNKSSGQPSFPFHGLLFYCFEPEWTDTNNSLRGLKQSVRDCAK